MTPQELSEKSGVSKSSINQYVKSGYLSVVMNVSLKNTEKEWLVSKNANYPGVEPFDDGMRVVGKLIEK